MPIYHIVPWLSRTICAKRNLKLFLSGYILVVLTTILYTRPDDESMVSTRPATYQSTPEDNGSNMATTKLGMRPTKDELNLTYCVKWNSLSVNVARTDRWQMVTDENLLVYSAFLDDRHGRVVKIIGLTERRMDHKIFCQFWIEGSQEPFVISSATCSVYPEQNGRRLVAAEYMCDLSGYPEGLPDPRAVSVVTRKCDYPQNLLLLHRLPKSLPPKYNFSVCLCGPLKFGLSNTNHLTEWLEMNRVFGAEHFIMYNHSASTILKPYIEYYEDRNLVEWLPWYFPEGVKDQHRTMKNFGHLALVNDCLYRSMYQSRHVVFVDTDEFIVPRIRGVTAWDALLDHMDCSDAALVIVRCVFFKKEWPDDEMFSPRDREMKLELVTQIKTKREGFVWAPRSRSKYIVRPETIAVTGIHQVWKWAVNDIRQCQAKPVEALLHHYRNWQDPDKTWIVDRYMHSYGKLLVERVGDVNAYLHRVQ